MGVLHALTRSIDAKDPIRAASQRVAELSRDLARGWMPTNSANASIFPAVARCREDRRARNGPDQAGRSPMTSSAPSANTRHRRPILATSGSSRTSFPASCPTTNAGTGTGTDLLSGNNIPLVAGYRRADSFDAMSSTRTYRPALPCKRCSPKSRAAPAPSSIRRWRRSLSAGLHAVQKAVAESRTSATAAPTLPRRRLREARHEHQCEDTITCPS